MKKTLTAITLAVILMFGATFANAGILVSDAPTATSTSTDKSGIIIFKDGIIIFAATCGIIIF